jgi:hypothetical protein
MDGDLFSVGVTSLIMSLVTGYWLVSQYPLEIYNLLTKKVDRISELWVDFGEQIWGLRCNCYLVSWMVHWYLAYTVFNLQLLLKDIGHLSRNSFKSFLAASLAVVQPRDKHCLEYVWAPSERIFDNVEWSKAAQEFLGRGRHDPAWANHLETEGKKNVGIQ